MKINVSIVDFITHIYHKYLKHLFPKRLAKHNGVHVNSGRLFDSVIPMRELNRPNYESGMISLIRSYVEQGDDVVVVGGGWGVTSVTAAKHAGKSGDIIVYEGSADKASDVQETAKINDVSEMVTVRNAVVGPLVDLRGSGGDVPQVTPSELPACDVLELDCEGSELNILRNMNIRPRLILVESHGMNNAPSTEIQEQLENMGYCIVEKKVADVDQLDACLKNDIYAMAGVQR